MPKIDARILSLPRRNRRALYLLARRDDPATSWEPYRRWDGGRPNVLRGFDVLAKAKKTRKETDKAVGGMVGRLFGRFGGLASHRLFRRKTA